LHLQTHETSFLNFLWYYMYIIRFWDITSQKLQLKSQHKSLLCWHAMKELAPSIGCKKYILISCHTGKYEVDIQKICFTNKVDILKIHFMNDQYTQSHKFYFNNTSNTIKFMWPYDHHHMDITHNFSLIMVMWLKHVVILIISLREYILCLYWSFVNFGLKGCNIVIYTQDAIPYNL
jgi:hypothetical protein